MGEFNMYSYFIKSQFKVYVFDDIRSDNNQWKDTSLQIYIWPQKPKSKAQLTKFKRMNTVGMPDHVCVS